MRRVPYYRQISTIDCGPACLQMVSAYYGKKMSLLTIKGLCESTRVGVSVKEMTSCCEKIGLQAVAVNVDMEDLKRIPLPAILYLKRGHFVVLDRIYKKRNLDYFKIIDPSRGRVKLQESFLCDDFLSDSHGVAIALAPTDKFEKGDFTQDSLWKTIRKLQFQLWGILSHYKQKYIYVLLLTLCVSILNWAMPLLLKTTIDSGIMNKDIDNVLKLLLCQLLFFVGFATANTVSSFISTKITLKTSIAFLLVYLEKVIKLPMQYFEVSQRTELLAKVSDLSRIQSFFTDNLINILFAILNVLFFSSILLVHSKAVFLIFMAFSLVTFGYNFYFSQKKKSYDYANFSLHADKDNITYEMMMGMQEIKLNNAQRARMNVWKKLEEKSNALQLKMMYIDAYASNGAGFFGKLRDIILTGLCALLVIKEELSMGTMMMISFLLGQLTPSVSQLYSLVNDAIMIKLSAERLNEVFDTPDEAGETQVKLKSGMVNEGICLDHVSFRYKGFGGYVLNDVNLFIPKGKVTAIVGASGSGKTTLLKLLLGFYYPQLGAVRLDNDNIETIELNSWRKMCGVVMQDGRIFSGTVAENIAMADEQPNLERMQYAARIACIDEKINKLPMKFQTRIGETGINLSGGEKQRLLIARAVYKNPEFVFFDEATSSLDATTERVIMHNLKGFYAERTVVVIAHRLSTVKSADNIVFIDKGRIVEQGTHGELIRKKGYYYTLVNNQLELNEKAI